MIDIVDYNPIGNLDDGAGSIFLADLTADNNDTANWALSSVGGATPVGIGRLSSADAGNSGVDVGSPGGDPAGSDGAPEPLDELSVALAGTITLGGAEIVDFDAATGRAFVTSNGGLIVVDASDLSNLTVETTLAATAFGFASDGVTSVSVENGIVAVSLPAPVVTDTGQVLLFDAATFGLLGSVGVGALPDAVKFNASGTHLVVSNEGQSADSDNDPSSALSNPEGSVSIVALNVTDLSASPVTTLGFTDASITAEEITLISAIQGSTGLNGFFVQEEDADQDDDPFSSEGLFIFDGGLGIDVNAGDLVRVTGTVQEFFGQTQIGASAIEIIASNQTLPTARVVTLGATGAMLDAVGGFVIDLEVFVGMLVTFENTLTVTEKFNLDRFDECRVSAGERPVQFTQNNAPDAEGFAAHLEDVAARTIVLDDGSNVQNPFALEIIDGNNGVLDAEDSFRMGDNLLDVTGVVEHDGAGRPRSRGGRGGAKALRGQKTSPSCRRRHTPRTSIPSGPSGPASAPTASPSPFSRPATRSTPDAATPGTSSRATSQGSNPDQAAIPQRRPKANAVGMRRVVIGPRRRALHDEPCRLEASQPTRRPTPRSPRAPLVASPLCGLKSGRPPGERRPARPVGRRPPCWSTDTLLIGFAAVDRHRL